MKINMVQDQLAACLKPYSGEAPRSATFTLPPFMPKPVAGEPITAHFPKVERCQFNFWLALNQQIHIAFHDGKQRKIKSRDVVPVWALRLLMHYPRLSCVEHLVAVLWLSQFDSEPKITVDQTSCYMAFDGEIMGVVGDKVVTPSGEFKIEPLNPLAFLQGRHGHHRTRDPEFVDVLMRSRNNLATKTQQDWITFLFIAHGSDVSAFVEGQRVPSASTLRDLREKIMNARTPFRLAKELIVPRWVSESDYDANVPPVIGKWTRRTKLAFFNQLRLTVLSEGFICKRV